ncbi:MAG TPA: hydrogenobyrinic acid a,c-diamide synthase (glutamine-hydrolyzing) [Burkholderiaceae bacterium]|nr:hydrogenobyrinic acid a,c-diamide synthase (glutamine-hydrolyzing) [Burkholderiaceae bacterium]
MSRLLISAAHKSSGKTTVTVGICAALTQRGLTVQPFKKGPDYIDPMWLTQACGRACFNLDPYLMSQVQIQSSFANYSRLANISIVEGNKGLYDGLALDGSNSNAALAKQLDLPVVLVLDARGMTRGIAPLILGYQAFDPAIRIAGVILNQIGGSRHESKLRAVIEHYTNVEVLGAIGYDAQLAVTERHLGLMPNHELDDAAKRVSSMGELIAQGVNLDRVLSVSNISKNLTLSETSDSTSSNPSSTTPPAKKDLRIGIAQDKSFGFYYQDDLLAFEKAGVELVPFDTMQDADLPNVDGIFIGGGFPEIFMPLLEGNVALRQQLHKAIEDGLPVYAECGGLMYLARSIRWKDKSYDMVGAIPADIQMHDKPIGRGYIELESTPDAPWTDAGLAEAQERIKGHEFHYSSLENVATDMKYAYRVRRGHGADGVHDGLVVKNVLASYAHLHQNASSHWVEQFVAFVRDKKKERAK